MSGHVTEAPAEKTDKPNWASRTAAWFVGVSAVIAAVSGATVAAIQGSTDIREALHLTSDTTSGTSHDGLIPDFAHFTAECGIFTWNDPNDKNIWWWISTTYSCDERLCVINEYFDSSTKPEDAQANSLTQPVRNTIVTSSIFEYSDLGEMGIASAEWPTILKATCKIGNCIKINSRTDSSSKASQWFRFSTPQCASLFQDFTMQKRLRDEKS